jgi:PAS domain S-box-containing protein
VSYDAAVAVADRHAAGGALQRTSQQLTALIESLTTGVLLVDEHGRVAYTNHAYCEMFGLGRPEDLVGTLRTDLWPSVRPYFPDPDSSLSTFWARLDAGVPAADELPLTDGRVLRRYFSPIVAEGAQIGTLWTFDDVTAEHANRQMLEDGNQFLRDLDELRIRRIAVMSHELRTPITSIAGAGELLASSTEEGTAEHQLIDIIVRNSERVLHLLDDLGLLNRLETSSVELELGLVDISELVRETVGALALQARGAGVELETRLATGPLLEGDALRLEQLIDNLLTNAVKFSGAGKRVVATTEYGDGEWTVSVTDDGPGLHEDDIPALLEPFARGASARERRIAGSGLGLAIVYGIAALHHATFELDSPAGQGTTATVRLPLRQPSDKPHSA